MSKRRFEMEVEVVRLYSVPVFAESFSEAALRCNNHYTANEIEELGEMQDHEVNVVGITRQKGRKMYN